MEVTKSETRQTTHKPLNACHVLIGEISTVVSALRFSPTPVKQKPVSPRIAATADFD